AARCPVDHGRALGSAPAPAPVAAPAADRSPATAPAAPRTRPAPRTWRVAVANGAVPVLGHALHLWRRPLEFLAGLPGQGDLVEIRLGPKKAYLACHPDLVMQVLLEARTFDKGGPLFEKARLLVGNGLVSSEWEDHRTQRRMLQPAFHPSRMPGYVSLMREEVEGVLADWQEGRAFDVSDAMHALTLRITARTMFSTSVGERAIPEVAYCMPLIMRGVYQRMVAPTGWQERMPTPGNRRFDALRARMHAVIGETIEDQRRAGTDRGDLLSILVNARDEDTGAGLTDAEIYDQVMTLLIGGTETTGNTMAWVFHVLAEHPEIERRLHAELDEVLPDGRAPEFADLPRLDYTWRVLNETLRMYPPAWLLTRTTTKRTELAGKVLEPGTIVMYSPYALGRQAAHFENPERFDPDRWLPDRSAGVPRGAMVPFSAGNRKCIGDAFGQAETTLTLATIATRWQLRPAPGAKPNVAVPKASLGTGPLDMIPTPRRRRVRTGSPTPSEIS
ncbi:cytochrome P450, partial [Actinacidiphila bryophytorum]|uniref:cytochrome P450 n=1 Tax=Actinacidiphila bryophytorum TaxID=1436133 RepID=UPI00360E0443